MKCKNRGGNVNTNSHLQNGNLGEIFLLKVGVRDELQLCLEETVERLQGQNEEKNHQSAKNVQLICFKDFKEASTHHSAEHAHALLNCLPGDVSLPDLQGLQVN